MAGSYADPPGLRIEYDQDGSGMVHYNSATLTPLTVAQMQAMNKEATGVAWRLNAGEFMGCMFPSAMTIMGAYTAGNQGGASHATGKFQVSTNTTTGGDGSWSDIELVHDLTNGGSSVNPDYRAQPTPMFLNLSTSPVTGVKGIRMLCVGNGSAGWDLKTFHILATPGT
jgi:hypothetical protein